MFTHQSSNSETLKTFFQCGSYFTQSTISASNKNLVFIRWDKTCFSSLNRNHYSFKLVYKRLLFHTDYYTQTDCHPEICYQKWEVLPPGQLPLQEHCQPMHCLSRKISARNFAMGIFAMGIFAIGNFAEVNFAVRTLYVTLNESQFCQYTLVLINKNMSPTLMYYIKEAYKSKWFKNISVSLLEWWKFVCRMFGC